ncbi:MAG: nickel-dependent hydrogenase large subunit [Candidatus Binatia bacterium]
MSALKADPKKTSEIQQSISPWPLSSPAYFRDVQNRLKKFVERPARHLRQRLLGPSRVQAAAEVDLLATTHYLEALDFQKDIVRIQTIFGGKNPTRTGWSACRARSTSTARAPSARST